MGLLTVAEEAVQYGIRAPKELPPSERHISPNDAARILNVTGECVKQWIYGHRLPANKLSNGYWKIKVRDLEDFIKARQNLGQKRIMIVDTTGSKELVDAVEKLGHRPIVAHSQADAILKAADLYPSVFIVNVSIREFDAWKLLDRIRNTRNIRNAPVLIITERNLKDHESEQALSLNAQGVLKRPFTAQTLSADLERIIKRIL